MNRYCGVVDPGALSVFARAQAAGDKLLLNATTSDRFTYRALDEACECLAIAKHALGSLSQLGLDAQGRGGGGLRVRCNRGAISLPLRLTEGEKGAPVPGPRRSSVGHRQIAECGA